MAHQIACPCGTIIAARDEDFLAAVRAHLSAAHAGLSYSDNEIMMLSMQIPDRVLPE